MSKVLRSDIVDYETYEERRPIFRQQILNVKKDRRIHLGTHLTFLFENKMTMLYQIQEMVRIEKIVKETNIQHEIDTYNGLLGGRGEMSCTLLIEISDPKERDHLLSLWHGLEKHLYLLSEDHEKIYAGYDTSQVGESRLSSVQYLKFAVGTKVPRGIGCDFPDYNHEVYLSQEQWRALQADLLEGEN